MKYLKHVYESHRHRCKAWGQNRPLECAQHNVEIERLSRLQLAHLDVRSSRSFVVVRVCTWWRVRRRTSGADRHELQLAFGANGRHRKQAHRMNRLFGNSSSAKPKPTLQDAISATDSRIDGIQVKVKKLDGELTRYRDQLKRMKGGPGKVCVFWTCQAAVLTDTLGHAR